MATHTVKQSVNSKYLEPYQGGPWLYNTWPRAVARGLLPGGATALVLGGIGGGQGMPVPLAFVLLMVGMGALVVGLGQWGASKLTPLYQYCPECLGSMLLGATRCPHCAYSPRRRR